MDKMLPLFHHSSRRISTFVQSGQCPCSIHAGRLNGELLSTFYIPLILHPQEGQRRWLATNRRRQRVKATGKGGRHGGGSCQQKERSRGKNRYRQEGQEMNVIRPPKNYMKKLPKSKLCIPPALIVPTASPYVYISQASLGNEEDEDAIDPNTLFAEVTCNDSGVRTIPPFFANGDFQYFSPKKDLAYDYPKNGLPEVAFLGRSNVGKSSLINAIMRKNLCLTSRVPGRTQLPYYYGLVPKNLVDQKQKQQQRSKGKDPKSAQGFVVDLPGYGYGRAPTKITEDWQQHTQDLLLHRRHEAGVLQRLFLLMDARRGMEGPNEHDRIVMRWLEDAGIPFSVVLTKADRVSLPLVVKQVNDFCLRFASQKQHHSAVAQSPIVHVTSSTRGWGIHELMVSIEAEFCGESGDEDGDSILD